MTQRATSFYFDNKVTPQSSLDSNLRTSTPQSSLYSNVRSLTPQLSLYSKVHSHIPQSSLHSDANTIAVLLFQCTDTHTMGYVELTNLQLLGLIIASIMATYNQCRDVGPRLPRAASVGKTCCWGHGPGAKGE